MSAISLKTLIRSMDGQRERLLGSSDSELLAAFCDHHSSKAFADIVDRYGTLVLRVCMRVLGDIHDAEDAFQATFLILARKANTIRNRSSLGSFLHGVAHRTARNLLRTRRRQKPQQSWTDSEDLPRNNRDIGWSEVQAALDEEIQKLPKIYRTVFIHCCLEGQSRADTARELGVKEGTLSSRLAQAKKILQVRLSRRGISLSSLLGALSLTMVSASQELRSQTTARVMEALAGGVPLGWSASIVTLAQRVHATPFLYQSLSVLTFLALLVVGATLSMSSTPTVVANEPHKELVPDPASPKQAATRLSASGTVVNPEGKPVAGATVYLREWSFLRTSFPPYEPQVGRDILSKMTTDETGQFSFKDVIAPDISATYVRMKSPYEILVIAPGYAPVWQHLTALLQKQPLLMQVNKPAQITGVVREANGKPAVGATIRLLDIGPMRRMFGGEWPDADYLYLKDSAVHIEVKSDESGRFTFADIPVESCVRLQVTHHGVAESPIFVAASSQTQHDLASITFYSSRQVVDFQPVEISPITINIRPTWQLRARIVAEDTGKPLSDVSVHLFSRLPERRKLTTEVNGVFTATIPEGKATTIACSGGKRYPEYLYQEMELTKPHTEEVVVKLRRGQLVAGQVVDAATGQGLAGATVSHGRPIKDEPGQYVWWAAEETNGKGEFQYYLPVGKVKLRAVTPDRTHHEMESELLEVSPGKPLTNLKLSLTKSKSTGLFGRVLGPNGRLVEGATVAFGYTTQRGQQLLDTSSGPNGHFLLPVTAEAMKAEQCELVVVHDSLHLGAVQRLDREGNHDPLDIKLKPLATITGHVFDPQDKPFRNARVVLTAQVSFETTLNGQARTGMTGTEFRYIETLTDQEGRYTLENILPDPGSQYRVLVSAPGMARIYGKLVTVDPGQTVDCGDIKLIGAIETISGIVVDQAGKPQSHIWVYAHPARKGDDTPVQGSPGIFVTKEDGKFTLRDLPKGKLELRYEDVRPGKGRTSRNTEAQMIVEAGRQDIRMVIERDK
ncbi:MAG: sigma-70 family RNA polymerase sigma factor [Gemmatales bacterium]